MSSFWRPSPGQGRTNADNKENVIVLIVLNDEHLFKTGYLLFKRKGIFMTCSGFQPEWVFLIN
jgi:hypothetical protein